MLHYGITHKVVIDLIKEADKKSEGGSMVVLTEAQAAAPTPKVNKVQ